MDVAQVQVETTAPIGGVRPKDGDAAGLAARIRARHVPHLKVYTHADMPARLWYDTGDRIAPVVLIPDDHWSVESRATWPVRRLVFDRANHGWDPQTPNMGALFIAHGPVFQRGVELPEVDNIQVYNLLCAVLGVKPAPNDGNGQLVKAAIRK